MAQDLGIDNAAGPTVTLLAADIADGDPSALTATIDFGNPTPLEVGFELIVTGQASADAFAFLQVAWSHDDSDYSDLSNLETVATIDCVASDDAVLVGSFVPQARYGQCRLENQTGGVIDGTAANTAIIFTDKFGDQA